MGLLDELKMTEVLQGEELDAALFAIRDRYTTEEDKRIMTEYMDARLDELERQMDELEEEVDRLTAKEQLGELYDIIPLSSIAEKYFKRRRGWLYQKLNGYKVNGKISSLNKEEKETFNLAIREIGMKIGSMQLA